MKKRLLIALSLLILLTTINSQQIFFITIVFKLNLEITNICCELIVVNNINRDKAITKRFFIY